MTSSLNHSFLIHISKEKIFPFMTLMFEQGVNFEFLNPKKLHNEWENVLFLTKIWETDFQDDLDYKINLLEKVIVKYDSNLVWKEKNFVESSVKDTCIKKCLDSFTEEEIIKFVQDILTIDIETDIKNRVRLEQKKIINGKKLLILKEICAYFTKFEMIKKIHYLTANFFTIKDNSQAIFALLCVPTHQEKKLESILKKLDINFEKHDWSENIITWQIPKNQEPILNYLVKNKLFTPQSGFKYNLWWPIACIILFSGVIISDVFYGLILLVFCFIFEYQKSSSKSWRCNIKSLLPVSIVAILSGIITGNFAGSFLVNSNPLKVFLSNFQLISFFDNKINLPINQLLIKANIPILYFVLVFFLAIFGINVCIQFFTLLSNNSIKNYFVSKKLYWQIFDLFNPLTLIYRVGVFFIVPVLFLYKYFLESILGKSLSQILQVGSFQQVFFGLIAYSFFGIIFSFFVLAFVQKIVKMGFLELFHNDSRQINSSNNFKYWKF